MINETAYTALSAIASSICRWPNLFVLGAGASFPHSPTTSQLRGYVIPQWLSLGSYPVTTTTRIETFERVIGTGDAGGQRIGFYLDLLRANANALDWLISMRLSIDSKATVPPNYALFGLLPAGSFILNLNLDQYANHLRPYHIVLEPHGRIPPNLRRIFSDKDIADFAEFEVPTPWEESVLLIRPEHPRITEAAEYSYLIQKWPRIRDVVVIGYSFSWFGSSMDDLQTFEFLCNMIKHYRNTVILIDPFPERTEDMLAARIGRKIIVAPFEWNRLSLILMSAIRTYGIRRLPQVIEELAIRYGGL